MMRNRRQSKMLASQMSEGYRRLLRRMRASTEAALMAAAQRRNRVTINVRMWWGVRYLIDFLF